VFAYNKVEFVKVGKVGGLAISDRGPALAPKESLLTFFQFWVACGLR
jgi:hypothetical protein